jgi:hypothetical protein
MGKLEKVTYGMAAIGVVYILLLIFSVSVGDWIGLLAFTVGVFGLEYFIWKWREELIHERVLK